MVYGATAGVLCIAVWVENFKRWDMRQPLYSIYSRAVGNGSHLRHHHYGFSLGCSESFGKNPHPRRSIELTGRFNPATAAPVGMLLLLRRLSQIPAKKFQGDQDANQKGRQ